MYAKLFTSIYQGTLRGDSRGLLVFTNLLAHCDASGTVDIHPRAISEEVGLPIDDVKSTLLMLESPDDESRSPEENGRRIVRLDEHRAWGWRVVNYGKYRAIRSEDDRREQNRLSQKRWRERNQSKPPSAEDQQDKPKQKKQKQKQEEKDSGLAPSARRPPPPPFTGDNQSAIKATAVTALDPKFELPESWGEDAEALGWPAGRILLEAEKFRQYWTVGKGAGSRKSLKGWRQAWSNWLGKAAK